MRYLNDLSSAARGSFDHQPANEWEQVQPFTFSPIQKRQRHSRHRPDGDLLAVGVPRSSYCRHTLASGSSRIHRVPATPPSIASPVHAAGGSGTAVGPLVNKIDA